MTSTSLSTPAAGLNARGVVARYFRIWNEGDPKLIRELLASDWVDHKNPDRESIDDVVRAITRARAVQGGTRIFVDALLGDETLVTVNGRIQTAERTEGWVWIVRMDHGRMHEMWTYPAG